MATLAETRATSTKHPLIVIMGSTGTVSLAQKYNGEIINADAVQMYKGLPILTNKIPEDERNGIKHHLIDHIGLEESTWTVHEFVEESSAIINEIRKRGKLPIVVGGTSYYVYGLLFPDNLLTAEAAARDGSESRTDHISAETGFPILKAPTEDMYAKLQEVDPEMAQQWHPDDRRKVQRSLEIWLRTGRKASEMYAEQKTHQHNMAHNPLIFWMEAEDQALNERLNARVDTMVKNGLLEELMEMRRFEQTSRHNGIEIQYDKGVWIAIGYRQFKNWLDAKEVGETTPSALKVLEGPAIAATQAATRRYAKTQNRWIRIRLANTLKERDLLEILFLLDCTKTDDWEQSVEGPSEAIVKAFLSGQSLPLNTSLSPLSANMFSRVHTHVSGSRQVHHCDICDKTMMSDAEWEVHLKSKTHKKVLEGNRRRARNVEMRPHSSEECRSENIEPP